MADGEARSAVPIHPISATRETARRPNSMPNPYPFSGVARVCRRLISGASLQTLILVWGIYCWDGLLLAAERWRFQPVQDALLCLGGLGSAALGFHLEEQIKPAGHWRAGRAEIFWLDRRAVFPYSARFDAASDVFLGLTAVLPYLAKKVGDQESGPNVVELAVLHLQTATWLSGLTSVVKWAAGRARPYVYHRNAPAERLASSDSRASFFSGHAAQAFAAAELLRMVGPGHGRRWLVHLGYGLAALTGASRVAAGQHFLTDVLIGAAAGYACARIVVALHRSERITVNARPAPSRVEIALVLRL